MNKRIQFVDGKELLTNLIVFAKASLIKFFMTIFSRVRVEYYVNENTFKERLQLYFIKNQRSSE